MRSFQNCETVASSQPWMKLTFSLKFYTVHLCELLSTNHSTLHHAPPYSMPDYFNSSGSYWLHTHAYQKLPQTLCQGVCNIKV